VTVEVCFEKRLGGTGREGKRGTGSAWARPRGGDRRRRGGAWRDGCQRRAAGNIPRPAGTGGAIAA
jgi:hypothetical protein